MAYETENTEVDQPTSARQRYEVMVAERQPYLTRAREAAELTIPSLMPPEGFTGATQLFRPYQSTGADGVNNLASKLLLVLFPPGDPFFRLSVEPFTLDKLVAAGESQGQDARGDIDAALGKMERAVVERMEDTGSRSKNFEALLHLIVTGNGLVHVDKKGAEKFFALDRFVVCRDLEGNVLEVITKECIAKEALDDELYGLVTDPDDASEKKGEEEKEGREEVEVFTWVQRTKRGWSVHQEVQDKVVPGSKGTYPKDSSAWIVLRWTHLSGEAYGRGRCEEYIGDLRTYESATKSVIQFGAAASKIVALVEEGGVTDKEAVSRAQSGDVIDGNAKDVTFLMLDKAQDFQVTKQVGDEAKSRLERAFLMATSIQRQAERVTAEEIRVMANELEQGLGGVYSLLSQEFQLPLVSRLMHVMSKTGDLPQLPKKTVKPQIVSGLDGLGRNTDIQRLDTLLKGTAETFGPEAVAQYTNVGAYMTRRAAALGIDIKGLIRTEQEIQAQKQQASTMELAGKLGGPAIGAMSKQAIAAHQAAQQQQQQPSPQDQPPQPATPPPG